MKNLVLILLILSGTQLQALDSASVHIAINQEKTLHPKDLPENIRKYITSNFNGAKITKATGYESGGVIAEYTVVIYFKEQEITLTFDKKGEFVKKE